MAGRAGRSDEIPGTSPAFSATDTNGGGYGLTLTTVIAQTVLKGASVGGVLTLPFIAKHGHTGLQGYAVGLVVAVIMALCKAELAGVMPHTSTEASHIYIRESLGQRHLGRVLSFVYCAADLYCLVPFEAAMLFLTATASLPPYAACFLFVGAFALQQHRRLFMAADTVLLAALVAFAMWVIYHRWAHAPTQPHDAFASYTASVEYTATLLTAAGYALYDMRAIDNVARYGTAPDLVDAPERVVPLAFALGAPLLAVVLFLKMLLLAAVFATYGWSWGMSAFGMVIGACLALTAAERLADSYAKSRQRTDEGYQCALFTPCTAHEEGMVAGVSGGVFVLCLIIEKIAVFVDLSVGLMLLVQLLPLAVGAIAHRTISPSVFRPFVTLLFPLLPALAVLSLLAIFAMTPSSNNSEAPIMELTLFTYFAFSLSYLLFAQARGFWPFAVAKLSDSGYHGIDAHERLYGSQLAPGLRYEEV